MMKFGGWGDPGKAYDLSHRPNLWPFVRAQSGLGDQIIAPSRRAAEMTVPAPRLDAGFMDAVTAALGAAHVSTATEARLLHTYGKSYRDLLRARTGTPARSPDAVLFPANRSEVEAILRAAVQYGVQVVPFGGGTNICGGVEPDPTRPGMCVTVSLRRMKRVLVLDRVARTARIEAGALGPELEAELNARGFSLGHFPDSFEFSTLGGWLATRSAGMQSDAYGKIEDMVVSLTLCTPGGTLVTSNVPRSATGPDLSQIAVGSEGTLGLITEAVMRVHPLGEREYRGILVPGFDQGINLVRELTHRGALPTTTRLSNQQETALGFAMKPKSHGAGAFAAKAFKAYLRHVKRFPFDNACLMIVGFEAATHRELAEKRRRTLAICREFGAVNLGTSVGASWFAGKYDYPYLRDVVMDRGGMVDVVETAATWDVLPGLYHELKAALHAHLRRGEFPGYVGCHLSHSYPAGACLYFTFAALAEVGRQLPQYIEAKKLIFELLLKHGATLTHHHAVGYELLPWMSRHLGETGLQMLRGLKHSVDPQNLCNPGKLIPGLTPAQDLYFPPAT
ncbi:MAG: FAD-binding oxidoreductase [Undibacterium sp.]|nr:FAD-binding oxidoreductase [Opitutaceae bacterium]